MRAAVVDASVWVSRLVPVDVHHAASRAWLETQAASGGQLVAPTLVLSEIAGAVSRRTGNSRSAHDAVAIITRLPTLRFVSVDSNLAQTAARLAADHALRGADSVYVALALELGLPLITLDQEQLTRTGGIISASKP